MTKFTYYNTDNQTKTNSIETLFPNWQGEKEALAVFSPHDDDAIIGAGYAMSAAQANGAAVYVYVMCEGNGGYSDPALKDKIADIRKKETLEAYHAMGIPLENIIYFGFSDFGAVLEFGWHPEKPCGSLKRIITTLRENKITRVMVPNHHREHADHTAVHLMGSYDSPQASDPIVVDWAQPTDIKTVLEYSVWADFSVENAVESSRSLQLKANRILKVSPEVEQAIDQGILLYHSQGEIIHGLIESRKERVAADGGFIELYIDFDPRPRLDFQPYIDFVNKLG